MRVAHLRCDAVHSSTLEQPLHLRTVHFRHPKSNNESLKTAPPTLELVISLEGRWSDWAILRQVWIIFLSQGDSAPKLRVLKMNNMEANFVEVSGPVRRRFATGALRHRANNCQPGIYLSYYLLGLCRFFWFLCCQRERGVRRSAGGAGTPVTGRKWRRHIPWLMSW